MRRPDQTDVLLAEDGRTVIIFADTDTDGAEVVVSFELPEGIEPAALGIEPA